MAEPKADKDPVFEKEAEEIVAAARSAQQTLMPGPMVYPGLALRLRVLGRETAARLDVPLDVLEPALDRYDAVLRTVCGVT